MKHAAWSMHSFNPSDTHENKESLLEIAKVCSPTPVTLQAFITTMQLRVIIEVSGCQAVHTYLESSQDGSQVLPQEMIGIT